MKSNRIVADCSAKKKLGDKFCPMRIEGNDPYDYSVNGVVFEEYELEEEREQPGEAEDDLKEQIRIETIVRSARIYPPHVPPGRFEMLTPDEQAQIQAAGRQVSQAAKNLREQVEQGQRPNPRDERNWPEIVRR